MMKKLIALTLSAMTVILFCGCGTYQQQPSDTTSEANKNNYMSIIDLLEGEIEQLRRDQLQNTAEYEATIAELEKQIAELMGSSTESSPSDTEEPSEASPFFMA